MTLSIMKEQVASSKNIFSSRKEYKKHTPFMTKMARLYITTAVNHTLWGRTCKKDEFVAVSRDKIVQENII